MGITDGLKRGFQRFWYGTDDPEKIVLVQKFRAIQKDVMGLLLQRGQSDPEMTLLIQKFRVVESELKKEVSGAERTMKRELGSGHGRNDL